MVEKWLFSLDEIGKEHNDLVGKKCANLGEIRKIGLRAPPGFVLTIEAYNKFMTKTEAILELKQYVNGFNASLEDVSKYDEASKVMRKIVESKQMPKDMEYTIASYYEALCQKCCAADVAVATRSAGTASHPGQYETYLNVKGESDLMKNIIKVWSSTFNTRSLVARARGELALDSDPIGVAVLKMVNARCAGICFTADPNTGDSSKITVEANWGLGESVVAGVVVPDSWILDKKTLEIVGKRLAEKTVQIVFQERGVVEEKIAPDKGSTFCISDEEAGEIARLAKILESHFGGPQDLEWAIDSGLPFPESIFLLQARPEVIKDKRSSTARILDDIFK
jgi:pyruvate,water dikinase